MNLGVRSVELDTHFFEVISTCNIRPVLITCLSLHSFLRNRHHVQAAFLCCGLSSWQCVR